MSSVAILSDPTTGAVLHCVPFTTGNPAVESVRGWLFVQQAPMVSSSLTASDDAPHPSDGQSELRPSPSARSLSSVSSSSSTYPTHSPAQAPEVGEGVEEDEKWTRVGAKRPSKVSAASPRSLPTASASLILSPSQSSLRHHSPSPSLSPLPPPHPFSSTLLLELHGKEHKALLPAVTSTSALLYVYDVPSHVTIPEFNDFISESSQDVVHMQMVLPEASASTSSYMVLLSMQSAAAASDFLQRFHLRTFNDIENDVCRVAHAHHVTFDDPRHHFPFVTPPPAIASVSVFPPPGVDELQLHVCPVCLDQIHPPSSPLLTILCLHHFHLGCLSLWSDSTCPVCRFSLHPAEQSTCSSCAHSTPSSLWMCLLCGHIGCSRYIEGHAYRHWQESGHGYTLSVSTQRVWDYVREEYVHRLVRNKGDGKLVELRTARKRGSTTRRRGGAAEADDGGEDTIGLMDEERSMSLKLEDLLIEYNYLLSSQLEQQRSFYQQQMQALERDHQQRQQQLSAELASLSAHHLDLAQRLSSTQAQADALQDDLRALDAEHERMRRQWTQLTNLNKALLQRQAEVRAGVERAEKAENEEEERLLRAKDAEVHELEQQLRDLEFFVQTQRKVSKSGLGADIQQGQLYVTGNDVDDAKDESKRAGAGNNKKKKKR